MGSEKAKPVDRLPTSCFDVPTLSRQWRYSPPLPARIPTPSRSSRVRAIALKRCGRRALRPEDGRRAGGVRRVLKRPPGHACVDAEHFARSRSRVATYAGRGAAAVMRICPRRRPHAPMQEVPVTADLLADEAQAPVIRMINALLLQALKERASDLHFEPYESRAVVRFRVDGVLRDVIEPPRALHAALVSRLKIMASLDIAEKRLPQDGRIALKLGAAGRRAQCASDGRASAWSAPSRPGCGRLDLTAPRHEQMRRSSRSTPDPRAPRDLSSPDRPVPGTRPSCGGCLAAAGIVK